MPRTAWNLDPSQVVPGRVDFETALKQIVPAAHRSAKDVFCSAVSVNPPALGQRLKRNFRRRSLTCIHQRRTFLATRLGEEDANNSTGDIMKPTTDQLEIAYYDDSDEEGNNLLLAEAATAGNKEDGHVATTR